MLVNGGPGAYGGGYLGTLDLMPGAISLSAYSRYRGSTLAHPLCMLCSWQRGHTPAALSIAPRRSTSMPWWVCSQLETSTIATWTNFTIARDLIWPITTMAMRHCSDGWPQCHRPVKLVETDESWRQLRSSLLMTKAAPGERWCYLCPSLLEVQASPY
jgi:hypothetical protein